MNLEAARAAMIDSQVRVNDVTDRRLISAMAALPREAFLPAERRAAAYADMSVECAPGRWLVAARDFSKLVNIAQVRDGDRVLDIAPGTGYSTAVLARLAREVVALEESEEAARRLSSSLAAIPGANLAGNIDVTHGPLKAGAPTGSPFDVIFVGAAVEELPQAWLDQLTEGGRLVAVVAEGGVRRARLYTASGGKAAWRAPFDAAIPPLPGFEKAEAFRL